MSDLARILAGPLIWLAAFAAIYGLQGASCAERLDPDAELWRALLIIVWVLAVAAQLGLLRKLYAVPRLEFAIRLARLLAWTALAATLWSLFPVILLPRCS